MTRMTGALNAALQKSKRRLASMPDSPGAGSGLCLSDEPRYDRHSPELARELALVQPELLAVLERFASGEAESPLFLHGPPGTGKSCGALALADHVRGFTDYHTLRALLAKLTDARFGRLFNKLGYTVNEATFWRKVGQASLAILDEIGSHSRPNDAESDALLEFCERRFGRPTIVISNLTLDELAKVYDDRIASRLASGTVFEVVGKDRRIEKPEGGKLS